MKKTISVLTLATVFASGTAFASGWRVPEQSVNSTARSGGYVAYTPSADASYYNPANMSWLEDRGYLEAALTWINLTEIEYEDNRSPMFSGNSEEENFLLPTFFAVSPYYNNFRVGLSLTVPGGLTKQWKDPYPKTFAEEFTLKVFEVNPTLSYKINDMFSIAAGIRGVYADGKVKSSGMVAPGVTASRDMDGDTWEAGYNLAISARPVENLNLAVTYRSNIDLAVEGSARLATSLGPGMYDGDVGVEVPLPAVFAVAASYTFFDQLTLEIEYDRTYWSEYEYLDFTYPAPLANPVLFAAFDMAQPRKWEDSDTWRFSGAYDFKNGFILMAGFAIDENPAQEEYIGFELPDSDAKLYSVGLRYAVSEDMDIGVAYLYDDKESRTVVNDRINGEFTNAGAHLLTFGLSYKL